MTDPFYGGLGGGDLADDIREATSKPRAAPGQHVEPVQIEWTRACAFKAKPCGACGKPKTNSIHRKKNQEEGLPFCPFTRRNGCEHCGKAKNDPAHVGAPESFNLFASGSWEAYQTAKKRWHKVLGPLLDSSDLPRGLHAILVEGEVSFGDEKDRDQGNHRVVIEKAFGDVLVEEGYIPRDTWDHYEFGGLRRVEAGVNRIRLTIFPVAPAPVDPPQQGSLL